VTAAAIFGIAIAAGALAALWPYLFAAPSRWPADPPGPRDDVARAVSSLRDLRFAEAAGTIDPHDAARLRVLLERSAFAPEEHAPRAGAPLRTIALAALVAGTVVIVAVQQLPQLAGDRAPGAPITGTTGRGGPDLAELEGRAKASPRDVPTLLALAEAYRQDGRMREASATYQAVLAVDRDNVPALNGLAFILIGSRETEGAMAAIDRALALQPKDPEALFLKGLLLYQKGDFAGAVDVWTVYLDVGEFHWAAPTVRPLYEDAKGRIGR